MADITVGRRKLGAIAVTAMLALALCATAAGSDDAELVDVSNKTSDIQKKIDELRANGRWSRQGELSASAVCGAEEGSQVFAPWGDTAEYVPAPQGNVEDISAWDVDDDVTVLNENAPFSTGSRSLLLTEGGEAVTPAMCISVFHPTIRFFAANTGSPASRLQIEILYEDLDGHVKKLKIARLRGGDQWAPSLVVPIHMNMLAAASANGVTAIALKFKAKDVKSKEAGWKIDDLAVDPWKDT
jgi:hypothetical protein